MSAHPATKGADMTKRIFAAVLIALGLAAGAGAVAASGGSSHASAAATTTARAGMASCYDSAEVPARAEASGEAWARLARVIYVAHGGQYPAAAEVPDP